jgi:hypothetical protein
MIRFDRYSFLIFLIVLMIEIVIGAFFRDQFVRYFLGDVFIVVLICYFIRSFLSVKLWIVILGTLIFAFLIELAQYFNVIDLFGWRNSQLAHLTIGSTFDWADLLAYVLGSGISWGIGHNRQSRSLE